MAPSRAASLPLTTPESPLLPLPVRISTLARVLPVFAWSFRFWLPLFSRSLFRVFLRFLSSYPLFLIAAVRMPRGAVVDLLCPSSCSVCFLSSCRSRRDLFGRSPPARPCGAGCLPLCGSAGRPTVWSASLPLCPPRRWVALVLPSAACSGISRLVWSFMSVLLVVALHLSALSPPFCRVQLSLDLFAGLVDFAWFPSRCPCVFLPTCLVYLIRTSLLFSLPRPASLSECPSCLWLFLWRVSHCRLSSPSGPLWRFADRRPCVFFGCVYAARPPPRFCFRLFPFASPCLWVA